MRALKKLVFLCLLMSLPGGAFAQITNAYTAGPVFNIISSNKTSGGMGVGLFAGYTAQSMISPRMEFYSAYYLSAGTAALSYKVRDNSGNFTRDSSSVYIMEGAKFMLGLNWYAIPKQLFLGAAASVSYNFGFISLEGFQGNDVIDVKNGEEITAAEVASSINGLNYGVTFTAGYRLPKVEFTLGYDLGLRNTTEGLDGYNTSFSQLYLGIHFNLLERSLAKGHQNKLIR
jgi:hypothetical protein